MAEDKETSVNFFSGLIFGTLLGAAGFFLLATERGEKVKKQLLKKLEDYLEDLGDSEGLEKLKELKEEIEEQKLPPVMEKIEAVKEQIENFANPAPAPKPFSHHFFRRQGQTLNK